MPTTSTDRLAGLSTSVAVKAPCRVAATSNITLSGEQTISSVAVVEGDRVLVTAQTTATENGIYVADAGAWARAKDFDGARDVVSGTLVLVGPGVGARFWQVTNTGTITIGTTSITLSQIDPSTLSVDADQVSLNLTDANTVDTYVAPFLNLKVKGARRSFGCAGDGSTNDYTKLNNALQTSGKIIELEAGTYLYNTALTNPLCAGIRGEGEFVSILKPGASVTMGLNPMAASSNTPTLLQDFGITGTLTTNAVGLKLGGSAGSFAGRVIGVRLLSFAGASGAGLQISNTLKTSIQMLTTGQCGAGLLISPVTGDYPTTTHFLQCVFTDSDTYGAHIKCSAGVYFDTCDFESSVDEGVFIDVSFGADITNLVFNNCWFEDNNATDGSAGYHVHASSTTRTVRVELARCFFAVDSAVRAQRAALFSGNKVNDCIIRAPRMSERNAETFSITNGATARTEDWPSSLNFVDNVVVDATSADYGQWGTNNTVQYPRAIPTIASATTIAPGRIPVSFVSGTTTIQNITQPWAGTAQSGGRLTLIPTGLWSTNTAGNIALATTAVVGKQLDLIFDRTTLKWYPSYT